MTHYHSSKTPGEAPRPCEKDECRPCSCYDPESSAPHCYHTCGKAQHSTCSGNHYVGPRMLTVFERERSARIGR